MNKNAVSFLVPTRIALTTLLPYMEKFIEKGFIIHVIGSSGVLEILNKQLSHNNCKTYPLEPLKRKRLLQNILHKTLVLLLTPKNFSVYWKSQIDSRTKSSNPIRNLAIKFLQAIPFKLKRGKINQTVQKILNPFFRNPFPTETVLATSVQGGGYLLTSRGVKTITILESWDQPSKYPRGYWSQDVLVWNTKLQKDWLEYQDSGKVSIGYPIKFNYVITNNLRMVKKKKEQILPRIMYPATFCLNSNPSFYREECRLLRTVSRATEKLGLKLFVKPKPNGTPGEFDEPLSGFDHIEVGKYQEHREMADYFLSADYNNQRLSELQRCDMIINLGTTFAIEAALFGLPILQLEALSGGDFPALAKAMNNFHLRQYILKNSHLVNGFRDETDIEMIIKKGVEEYASKSNGGTGVIWKMRDKLRSFAQPEKSFEEAADLLLECCTRELNHESDK